MFELSADKNSLVKGAVWMGMGVGFVLILALLMGGVFAGDVKASELSDMLDECNDDYTACYADALDDYIDCELGGITHPPGFCVGVMDYRVSTCDLAWEWCLGDVEEWFFENPTPSPSNLV